jgi:hypothetical protein
MKKWSLNFPLAPTTHTSHHTELKVSNFEGKLCSIADGRILI